MAHQLKYYKEIDSHGHLWRVEFLQDTEGDLTPVEIGPVLQGLRLVLQGDQANVDTPIVKTSLEMSFIDAPDMDESRKCGYWEEFYTSSATEFMVCLYKDGEKEWSGYVTPDSFAEDLRYRGSVTIIARDNLGTLQDLECDASVVQNQDSKVRIMYVILRAITKSQCALDFDFDQYQQFLPFSFAEKGRFEVSGNAAWQYLDVEALSKMTWYDALEKTLYSIGAVLRYVGKNRLVIVPLKDIPKCGHSEWWDIPLREVRFVSYGHRELLPGVKSISETHEFSIEEPEEQRPTIEEYISEGGVQQRQIRMKHYDYQYGEGGIALIPAWSYKNKTTGTTIDSQSSALLNVSAYERVKGEDSEAHGAWDDSNILYYAVNATINNELNYTHENIVEYSYPIYTTKGKVSFSFTVDKPVSLTPEGKVMNTPIQSATAWGITPHVRWRLKLVRGSEISYYDDLKKSWGANTNISYSELNTSLFTSDVVQPTIIERNDIEVPGPGVLSLEILAITIAELELKMRLPAMGMYMRIRDINIKIGIPDNYKTTMLNKLTLTTENSDKYAVRLTRDSEFAINETQLPEVAMLPNAILFERLVSTYYGVGDWSWFGRKKGEGISLARLIHQQLIAYHGKPNNVLTGELIGEELDFNGIWVWNSTPHLLISGALNILTGHMENATLREYKRYDHIWETWVENEDVTVDYAESLVTFRVHSTSALGQDSWKNFPSWIRPVGDDQISANEYLFGCIVEENTSGEERVAIFTIDTARVRVRQLAAGDYGLDYGEDYS